MELAVNWGLAASRAHVRPVVTFTCPGYQMAASSATASAPAHVTTSRSKAWAARDQNGRMTTNGVAGGVRYETVGVQLRAPRVAVVFEGDDDWQFWARDAMRQVTACWAGAGFVLVPHHGGVITPAVAQAVQQYDPDFVVPAQQLWRLREAVRPGSVKAMVEGDITDEFVARLVAGNSAHMLPDALQAREWLARHCSPYARFNDGEWDESDRLLPTEGTGQLPTEGAGQLPTDGAGQLVLLDTLGITVGPCRAVPSTWGGSVATAAASQVGTLSEPDHGATSTDDDAAVLAALLGVHHASPPNSFVHSPTGLAMSVMANDTPTALSFSTRGLDLTRRGPRNRPATWVVGNSSDDFALAMILNRTQGQGTWIDPSWADDTSQGTGQILSSAASRASKELVLMSISLDPAGLVQWQEAIGIDAKESASVADKTAQRDVRFGRPQHQYTLLNQHDRRHTLPLMHEGNGTVKLASTPPLPTVEDGHPIDTARVPVQVDLLIPETQMPTGRGFDAHVLADGEEERWVTWIRSSRAGVSYQSQRYDFVLAGATSYGRLAAPKLRVLGLKPWVEAMAQQSGYSLRTSDPGRRTDILAQLWGGREAMAGAIASPLREALQAFTPPKQDKGSYLDGGAVRLTSDRGVLSFDGLVASWPTGTPEAEVRAVVDDLLERRILRRGLIMRCPACSQLDFFVLDQLAQRLSCALCGAGIAFVQENWKLPVSEPQWFYDAHPAARLLLPTNSDLPLILGHHLGRSARRAFHVGELELVQAGKAVAETDLIALIEDQLIVAEVKANTDLAGGGKLSAAVEKRIRIAWVVRADQIVLATSKTTPWPSATVKALKEAIVATTWFGRPPAVRLISGLATADTVDVIA